jgi:hypothetical protein
VPLKSHTDAKAPVNFNVPFIIWLGADTSPSELVALNSDRRAVLPASEHIGTDAVMQPIRSAESGNVALQLLGLPPVPGSVFNAKQDLQFTSVEPGPLRQ